MARAKALRQQVCQNQGVRSRGSEEGTSRGGKQRRDIHGCNPTGFCPKRDGMPREDFKEGPEWSDLHPTRLLCLRFWEYSEKIEGESRKTIWEDVIVTGRELMGKDGSSGGGEPR